jgi:hypothetical protein
MSEVVRDWKRFHTRINHAVWQEGYFDHRLRPDERGVQLTSPEDDEKEIAAGANIRRQSRSDFATALRTTRSTSEAREFPFYSSVVSNTASGSPITSHFFPSTSASASRSSAA